MLSVLKAFLLAPIFVEDEPFEVALRKAGLLVLAAMASVSAFAIFAFLIIPHADPYDHGWIAFRIAWLCCVTHGLLHFTVFNYAYMRITRTAPVWLADLAMFGTVCTIMMLSIAHPQGDMRAMMIIASMMGGLMSTPRIPVHLFLQFCVYFFTYLRDSWTEQLGFLAFSFDRPFPTLAEKIMQVAATSWCVLLGVAGIHIIVRGYIERNEQQRLTRKLTLDVSSSLIVYDMDAVEETLKQNEGLVDSVLLQSFNDIKENLKTFRPHIPQYLIDVAIRAAKRLSTTSEDEDEVSDEGDISEGDMSSASAISRSSRVSQSNKSSTSTMQSSMRQPPPPQPAAPPPQHSAHNMIGRADAYVGQITSAFVDLGLISAQNGLSQLASIADTINEIAGSTKTSIHTIQGDALFASWNATRRIANHARYGCLFVSKLRETLAEERSMQITGSVVMTACHTMFAGTKQSHLLLMGDGLRQHSLQRKHASSFSTFVVNHMVANEAQTWGLFAGFAENDHGHIMYDLVGPKPERDDNEWMYQLEGDVDPWEPATLALAAIKSGMEKEQVLQELEATLTDEVVRARPSVMHLLKTLQESVRAPTIEFPPISPHEMPPQGD